MSGNSVALEDALDRPVWSALTGRQVEFAQGDGRAVRFAPEFAPFAAASDSSAVNLAALTALAGRSEIWLMERGEVDPPYGLQIVKRADCIQMVASKPVAGGGTRFEFEALGDADAVEMQTLAALTQPGPFSTRTHCLGSFIGIRDRGRLIAMAGERLKPGRYTEVSGVCTHPDCRGLGYASFLMREVVTRIIARGEIAFLHSYAGNTGAIGLYESLGFRFHQSIVATVLAMA